MRLEVEQVAGCKWCSRCEIRVPLSGFTQDRNAADGLRRYCRECNRGMSRRRYEQASVRQRREWDLLKTYGLSHDAYDQLLASQGGCCALCERLAQGFLVVDHDHATGAVRGLLCQGCNVGLGAFGDSLAGLSRAIRYLRRGTALTGAQ
jgi:hypothetical protein